MSNRLSIWLKVSDDEFELPEVLASSCSELARKCGIKPNSIRKNIYNAKRYGYKAKYEHIYIEVENESDIGV